MMIPTIVGLRRVNFGMRPVFIWLLFSLTIYLRNAEQLVMDYNLHNNIDPSHFLDIDDEEEIETFDDGDSEPNGGSDFEEPVKPKKSKKDRKKKKLRLHQDSDSDVVDMSKPKQKAVEALQILLDPDRLESELEDLKHGHTYQKLPQGYKALSSEEIVKNFVLS